jgi:hypothetical protein
MAFTPEGLPSANRSSIMSISLNCISRASFRLLFSAWLTSSLVRVGYALASTEITPAPPEAITGRAIISSPEITAKFSGLPFMIFIIWSISPDASLTATIFSQTLASSMHVSADMLHPVLPGTL